MSKVSKIDQIHIRAVMLCMSKMLKILKQAITDFLEFISLLSKMSKINQIHIRAVMLCMSKMLKILKQAITDFLEFISLLSKMSKINQKDCNAMYVRDVKDGKRTYMHIIAHNFLNIQPIFNPQKVLRS